MNNTITEMKNALEGISDLEDRIVEITAKEQNKEKIMEIEWRKYKKHLTRT